VQEVARTKLSDALVTHFAREIVSGRVQAGDTLPPEPNIAVGFGVSRLIVRESFQILASLGMVRVQQGKRTVVLESTEWDVVDLRVQEAFQLEGRGHELNSQLYEARIILETNSAQLAAKRSGPDDIEALQALVSEMNDLASGSRDLEEFLRIDRAFHERVAQASGNQVIQQVIREVHRFLAAAWSKSTITQDELPYLVELHNDIANAIAGGDAEAAGRAVDYHLTRAANKESARQSTVTTSRSTRERPATKPGA
jgi:DNA-binding FadR family transcriptional regulator